MRTLLLIVGSALPLIFALAYVVSIVRGQSRPQRMTRFLLVFITSLSAATLWAAGDTSGLWLALASFIEATLVFILSLKYGMGGRDRLDGICMALCVSGVALWILSDNPLVGLAASIAADFIATLPALLKTIRLPHTELAVYYASGTVAGLLIILAGPFTLQAIAFPAYIALIDGAFVVAIVWSRKRLAAREYDSGTI
jgi:hypothetical protein